MTGSTTTHIRTGETFAYAVTGGAASFALVVDGGSLSGVPPSITSPLPGTTLPGSMVTFQWAPNDTQVTAWQLDVGSGPGAADFYTSGVLPSGTLSATATGLPTGGQPVFARLSFESDGVWAFTDGQYTAAATDPPAITDPTPGTVLAGATETFQWTANGNAVSGWQLHLGSSIGGTEFYSTGILGSGVLSATATGLPTDGQTVYARLSFLTGTGWAVTDLQYTAATIAPPVAVPDVVGQAQATAETTIVAAGLVVGTVTTAPSATVPAGDVISQSPPGGTSVPLGSTVDLVISTGPPPVAVPDVVGQAQATAETTIVAAGLVVGTVTTAPSATVPAGDVISQSPPGGTSVPLGSTVDLVISTGPPPVAVPDVVGQAQATAETTIVAAGLVVGTVTTAPSATVPAGDVISQSPPGGTSVPPGSTVDLVISTGPPPVAVPDVVGQAQATAETTIVAAGLVVGTVTTAPSATVPAGDVISQSPPGGTSVPLGWAVDLVISLGPVSGPTLQTRVVPNVTNDWTTVTLGQAYASMVVICSPNYDSTSVPLVTRLRNASGDRFDVRVDRTDELANAVPGVTVHCLAVEEGVYTEAEHGATMEAVKYTSSVTDHSRSWVGESRTFAGVYSVPVVLGQVMTYADPDFSVFWARGSSRGTPPSSGSLWVGKHVGEDPDRGRLDEVVGYLVIEAGGGTIDAVPYLAGVGNDTVRGVGNRPPYVYSVTEPATPTLAVVSASAMDGRNGGWPILYGSTAVTPGALNLAFEEDQAKDTERRHSTEQVAYVLFGPDPAP